MGSARLGVLAVVFLHGAGAGMWVARIPAAQEHLELGVGALGLALLAVVALLAPAVGDQRARPADIGTTQANAPGGPFDP